MNFGLVGAGAAITLVVLVDVVVTVLYLRIKYSYVFSRHVLKYTIAQIPLGLCALAITFLDNALMYWCFGALLVAYSTLFSYLMLRQKVQIWERISGKFSKMFKSKSNMEDGKG